ncbi:MAG: S24/S26 family peptidase [Clostridia bacterium]|nr:S24/S26 family peptidase [Clostridia bacterium]
MHCSQSNTLDYKSILERDGVIIQLPTGKSMKPMLIEKQDTVVIRKVDRKLRANDVVFYLNNANEYVLHRIIKVKKDGYVIRGDNNAFNEYDITDKHIIGILSGFYKKNKYIDCEKSFKYKCYVQFNRRTYYIRYLFKGLKNFMVRALNKLKK